MSWAQFGKQWHSLIDVSLTCKNNTIYQSTLSEVPLSPAPRELFIWSGPADFSTSQICDMGYRIQSKWARAEVRIDLMELYGHSLSSHVIYCVKSGSSWVTFKVQVIHWFEKVRDQKSVVSHLKCFLNLIIYYPSLPLTTMDGFPSPLINMFLHNGAYKSVTSGTTGYQ